MRDPASIFSFYCQLEAIKAEIEAAKLDNQLRIIDGTHHALNYPPEWFLEKAHQMNNLAGEIFKYT